MLDLLPGTLSNLTPTVCTLPPPSIQQLSGTGAVNAIDIEVTGSGSNASVAPRALLINLNAGYTGSRFNAALNADQQYCRDERL
jgi:hypothetical protein